MSMKNQDHYGILEIITDDISSVSITDIKKSYRKQALIYHPDKGHPTGDVVFKLVAESYETLADEGKKRNYDSWYKRFFKRCHVDQSIITQERKKKNVMKTTEEESWEDDYEADMRKQQQEEEERARKAAEEKAKLKKERARKRKEEQRKKKAAEQERLRKQEEEMERQRQREARRIEIEMRERRIFERRRKEERDKAAKELRKQEMLKDPARVQRLMRRKQLREESLRLREQREKEQREGMRTTTTTESHDINKPHEQKSAPQGRSTTNGTKASPDSFSDSDLNTEKEHKKNGKAKTQGIYDFQRSKINEEEYRQRVKILQDQSTSIHQKREKFEDEAEKATQKADILRRSAEAALKKAQMRYEQALKKVNHQLEKAVALSGDADTAHKHLIELLDELDVLKETYKDEYVTDDEENLEQDGVDEAPSTRASADKAHSESKPAAAEKKPATVDPLSSGSQNSSQKEPNDTAQEGGLSRTNNAPRRPPSARRKEGNLLSAFKAMNIDSKRPTTNVNGEVYLSSGGEKVESSQPGSKQTSTKERGSKTSVEYGETKDELSFATFIREMSASGVPFSFGKEVPKSGVTSFTEPTR